MEPRIHDGPIDATEAEAAFREVRDAMNALEPHQLVAASMDVDRAVRIVLASVRHMIEHRDRMVAMPTFKAIYLDCLATYALAAWYASRNEPVRANLAAWTLMYHAYDQCRRTITYLRWYHEDADEIAPPLGAAPPVRSMH